jgi:hypothetical protein
MNPFDYLLRRYVEAGTLMKGRTPLADSLAMALCATPRGHSCYSVAALLSGYSCYSMWKKHKKSIARKSLPPFSVSAWVPRSISLGAVRSLISVSMTAYDSGYETDSEQERDGGLSLTGFRPPPPTPVSAARTPAVSSRAGSRPATPSPGSQVGPSTLPGDSSSGKR